MIEGTFLRLSDLLSSTNHKLSTHYFSVIAEFFQNFEEETGRIETSLDPINSPIKDEGAMNVLRLESRLASVVDYLARLKVAVSRIDTALWPRVTC